MLRMLIVTTLLAGLISLTPFQVIAQNGSSFNLPATPTLIAPGIVSTEMGEYSPALDFARGELYFMRRTPGLFDYTIYVTQWIDGAWSIPQVASFSGTERDDAPYISPSGNELFFDSSRPVEGLEPESINLWKVSRGTDGWQEPEFLRAPSTNPSQPGRAGSDEFGPVVDSQGTLYFYSFRAPFRGGHHYRATGEDYETVERELNLPDPSARTFVSYAYISPDGNTAILEGRAAGRRDRDLFYSCMQQDGSWGQPLPLDIANTPSLESKGWMTPDGQTLLFASNRNSGNSKSKDANIYWMSTRDLPIPCTP